MSLKVNITLKRLATISFAASLINKPHVLKILDVCIKNRGRKFEGGPKLSWQKSVINSENYITLNQQFVHKLEKMNLPNVVLNDILHVINLLLDSCLKWFAMVRENFGFGYVTGEFYWTCYGEVDTAKIVEKEWTSWLNTDGLLQENFLVHSGIPENECISRAKVAIYYMACACVLEDYVKSHWYEILMFCQEYSLRPYMNEYIIDFIVYSIHFLTDAKTLERNCQNPLVEAYLREMTVWRKQNILKMFKKSVDHQCEIAAQYYWSFLDLEQQDCGFEWITSKFVLFETCPSLRKILMLLFVQLSDDKRREIFVSSNKKCMVYIMSAFIDGLAWEQLFFPVFGMLKVFFDKDDYYYLLRRIVKCMRRKNYKIGYDWSKTTYYRMFLNVFYENRRHTSAAERYLITDRRRGTQFVKLFDLQILKLIREFECNDEWKSKFVEPDYCNIFGKLVLENQFTILDQFVEVVLTLEADKNWFRKYFDWHSHFVVFGQFRALDNLLNWQCESIEERKNCKYNAVVRGDLMKACGYLFSKGKMMEAEEFKNWGLSDDEERRRYMADYKTSGPVWLCDMWLTAFKESKNYDSGLKNAKSRILKFLRWFWETDEVAIFLEERLINIETFEYIIDFIMTGLELGP